MMFQVASVWMINVQVRFISRRSCEFVPTGGLPAEIWEQRRFMDSPPPTTIQKLTGVTRAEHILLLESPCPLVRP